ncbi:MAG: VWA domain-containing protein [Thiotrichales bacterium]|nr:VWA domain-containing protein [Thiotrichales bacterium]
MSNLKFTSVALVSCSLLVTACGGGSSTESSSNTSPGLGNQTQTQNLTGTIAIPTPIADTMANISVASNGSLFMAQTADCSNVPDGYDPLPNANIILINQSGNSIGNSTATDECGMFNISAPQATSMVSASAPGVRDIVVPVTQFTSSSLTGGLASTIPNTSTYEIGSLSILGSDTISFTIVDSDTGTAVIGAPPSAFSASLNGSPIGITASSNTSAASTQPASVGLAMDASGSMFFPVINPNDSTTFTQYELAALSAHEFLDQKSPSDEVSITIFDGQINAIDDASIADLFDINDSNAMPITYTFSPDGFTTDSNQLRFIVDAYTPSSQLYGDPTGVALHPNTPNVGVSSFYPWGGSTAFLSATEETLQRVASRGTTRKIIIAMTDGFDNSSQINESQLINAANAENIPVFTIGFGQFSDNDVLQQIADETGGSFFLAEGADITAAFQSIGTNVQFFYTANLSQDLVTPFDLMLNLNFNTLSASRNLIQN